jgi:hypothetical protein
MARWAGPVRAQRTESFAYANAFQLQRVRPLAGRVT